MAVYLKTSFPEMRLRKQSLCAYWNKNGTGVTGDFVSTLSMNARNHEEGENS
jgi:hypothetical protein